MKLKFWNVGMAAMCGAILTLASPAHAQDSALLDALVKKGVLSDQEAEDIRAQDQTAYNQTAASKISLASSIKTITFYGDLRLRYEMRDGTVPSGTFQNGAATTLAKTGDSQTLNRWRYRLRFGVKGTLYDNFFFGLRASSNPTYDRSGNVTFGHSDGAGEFGKGQNLLALDQVYLGWHATDDITLTGGQMPNPFYTTSMIWDDNLNPAGAAEQYDHTFGDTEVFATAGQFVYQAGAGNGITNGIGGSNFSNTFMYGEQVGFKYKFNDDTFFKGAASFYTYSGSVGTTQTGTVSSLYSTTPLSFGAPNASPSFFNGPYVGALPAPYSNVSGINDLAVLEVPMEFDFKIGPGKHSVTNGDPKDMKNVTTTSEGWSLPIRIFGDFAYNVEAEQRANDARKAINSYMVTSGAAPQGNIGIGAGGTSPATTTTTAGAILGSNTVQNVLTSGKGLLDQIAYQVGAEAGQLKKKGDWDGKLYWQSTGYYAVDPNLIDADIFNAATNMQGVVASVSHNWTDGLSSTVRYAYGMPVNGLLATPSVNQDLQIGDIKHYNLFQADLMWKF